MWSRPAAALGLFLLLTALGSAQPAGSFSRAVPPDKAVLERLNLRTEWTVNLPIEGKRDSIQLVQTFDDQLYIQTRTGLLFVVDVLTGRVQWSASLGNGGYTNVYPAAVNSQFVYVTNVTKLYAFYRYTGVTEFVLELNTVPLTGLAADESGVYAILAGRPGAVSAHRAIAFNLPRPIAVADAATNANLPATQRDPKLPNPVDDLTRRYPPSGAVRTDVRDEFEGSGKRAAVGEVPAGGMTGSRTPSLAALPKVTPPYRLEGQPISPSLTTIPTLRQPYHLRDRDQRDIQRTPSIGTIPPSVAASLALADLRPRGVVPPIRWEYGLANHIIFTPAQTPYRLWVVADNRGLYAISKVDKGIEVSDRTTEQIVAPPGQAGDRAYVTLSDGQLLAAEVLRGNTTGGVNFVWRVNVGGLLNHQPYVTEDAVFASGDNSGVTRVDRATGNIVWRSDRAADLLLAANQEFVYIRDRQGRVHVYDAKRATDPLQQRSVPLTGLDLSEFNVPVVNTVSDRLFLAADNGLIVCVRDASPKYLRPMRMAPDVPVNPPPKGSVNPATGGVPMLPPEVEKKDEKKDEKKN